MDLLPNLKVTWEDLIPMSRPYDYWHKEILSEDILDNLDAVLSSYEEILIRLAQMYEEGSEGAPPEFLARQVGYWLVEQEKTPEFTTPVYRDTDGKEGEKLALGYIGVIAYKLSRGTN